MKNYIRAMLKEGRTKRSLRQEDVAKIIGVKKNTISNYENGISEPDIDTLIRLCEIYEINCCEILEKAYNLKTINSSNLLEQEENNQISKYNMLDEKGKHAVDSMIELEYNRCNREQELTFTKEEDIVNIENFPPRQKELIKDLEQRIKNKEEKNLNKKTS